MDGAIPPEVAARLLDTSAAALVVTAADGSILHVSNAAAELLGREAGQLVGTNVVDLLHPDDVAIAVEGLSYIATRRTTAPTYYARPYRVRHTDGSWVSLGIATENRLDDPLIHGFVLGLRPLEIEEAVRTTLHLVASSEPLDDVLRHVVDQLASFRTPQYAFIHHHGGGVAVPSGPSVVVALGEALRAASDDPALPWNHPEVAADATFDADDLPPDIRLAASRAGLVGGWLTPVNLDGERVAVLATWRPEHGLPRPAMRNLVERFADLAALAFARSRFEEQLNHRASHDSLTDLANRGRFYEELGERCVAGSPVAVVYLDLDRFKELNDEYGHVTGDEVLVVVARRIEAQIRSDDLVARLGGDEFAVILSDVDAVAEVAARIEDAVRRPIHVRRADRALSVGASVGWAVRDDPELEAEDVVDLADRSMLRAKAARGHPR